MALGTTGAGLVAGNYPGGLGVSCSALNSRQILNPQMLDGYNGGSWDCWNGQNPEPTPMEAYRCANPRCRVRSCGTKGA